jgi:hypothetical protein
LNDGNVTGSAMMDDVMKIVKKNWPERAVWFMVFSTGIVQFGENE